MKKIVHKDLTALEIGEQIKKQLGINIYSNTRMRPYVEARALMCYILRNKLKLHWTSIAKLFESQGKHMNHSNALHLVKMYPMYRRDDKRLAEVENTFFFSSKTSQDDIAYISYLENKCEGLEQKCMKLEKQIKHNTYETISTDC